ncbi:MAG: AAC(3) family N-acetyltransferase [Anaerolineales bacterium]
MISYRDIVQSLQQVGVVHSSRLIVHASLSAFGPVAGGAETLVGALLASAETVVMPSFTSRTMVIPPVGPPDNAMDYSDPEGVNDSAEIFQPDLAADEGMGVVAETLRLHPKARRSPHPLLSFTGVNAEEGLVAQSLEAPLAPIAWLAEYDGDALLMGVDHRANTSLHWAEKLAARKQFVRWALTPTGVVICPGMPGCPDGFGMLASRLEGVARRADLGGASIELIPLRDLLHVAGGWIREDPRALLCDRPGCERCAAVRAAVRAEDVA